MVYWVIPMYGRAPRPAMKTEWSDEMSRCRLSRADRRFAVVCTTVFSMLAHLYRWMCAGFALDSMMFVESVDIEGQIALGRFMQPVYWQVRGYITSPPVVGLFATAFLALAALLILDLTGIVSRAGIALTCGVLAVNETLSASYASYLSWVDVYMLALLLAVAACWLQSRYRRGFLVSPVLYCLSAALYQSYLQAAVTTVLLMLIARALDGEKPMRLLLEGIGHALTVLAGLLLYAVAYKWVIRLYGTTVSDSYNTVANATAIDLQSLPGLLGEAYCGPLTYLFAQNGFAPAALNWVLLAAGLACGFLLWRRVAPGAKALVLLLTAMLPFGMNFVTVISKGLVHMLMNYAYFFFYLFVIRLAEGAAHQSGGRLSQAMRAATTVGISAVIAMSCLTAQTLYVKRDLELQSTLSVMTRVLDRLEATPGYVPGETPVVLLGYLPSSKLALVRPGFERVSQYQGMRSTYADAYEASHPWYMDFFLGWPVNLVTPDEARAWQNSELSESLPGFPSEGCIQIIDGMAFVRLS